MITLHRYVRSLSKSMSEIEDSRLFFSIPLVSCVMWIGALESSGVLLSYYIVSLA